MPVSVGPISVGSIGANSVSLSSPAASGGTAPYTYQWYRSLVSGFVPGPATEIAGATALNLEDTGLIPGTQYYYKMVATDDSTTPQEGTTSQAALVTAPPTQSVNQFAQSPYLGMIDMRFPYNTVSVLIDQSESGTLYAGSPVKIVNSAGGVPKVVACTAENDVVFGYINYDIKTVGFTKGMPAEVSMSGNYMFLIATGPIDRMAKVVLDLNTNGGVKAATGSTGDRIVGNAYDKAANSGQLIRVELNTKGDLDS